MSDESRERFDQWWNKEADQSVTGNLTRTYIAARLAWQSAERDARERCAQELLELAEKLKASKAHTYASENTDHYRGFDAGCLSSAGRIEVLAERLRAEKG